MSPTKLTIGLLVGFLWTSPARGQTAAPIPAGATAPGVPVATPGPSANDPNLDRSFLLPTAVIQPPGSVTYNNYEVLLNGFTLGLSQRIQVSFTFLAPFLPHAPLVGAAAIKGRIVSAGRFHFALQGSVGSIIKSANRDGLASAFALGAFASACLREDCSSLLSASITGALGVTHQSENKGRFAIYGASLAHAVTPNFKMLLEVVSVAARTGESAFDSDPPTIVSYGIRFCGANAAGDLGFEKWVAGKSGLDGFPPGIPFASFAYRWLSAL